jgi:hypothetical protein
MGLGMNVGVDACLVGLERRPIDEPGMVFGKKYGPLGHRHMTSSINDLPAAAPCVFPQFSQLHLWILIVEGADPGVNSHPSDRAIGFLRESGIVATLLSSHRASVVGHCG